MAPGVMVTVSKSEKVLWVHGGKTEDNSTSIRRAFDARSTAYQRSYRVHSDVIC